jgi:hypothetical protein
VATKNSDQSHWPHPDTEDAARKALKLADEREEIRRRIHDIEHCIHTSPKRHLAANELNLQVIPPPEAHISELYRHPVSTLSSSRPLMRRQAAEQLTQRRKNMLVFIIAALLFSVFVCWVSRSL